MPDFSFEIDGTAVKDPNNIRRSALSIKRDEDTDGILRETTTEFTLSGDGYDDLVTAYDADKCGNVDVELFYDCEGAATTSRFTGVAYMTEVTWHEGPEWKYADLKVHDDHYTAKIQRGRDTKCYIGVGRSRNDTNYTGATTQSIDMFRPSSGAIGGSVASIEMYTVADAFEDLISFMTDDTVTFTNNVTELDTLCICTGAAINNTGGTGNRPYTSFDDLFQEVKKKYNIGFYIDTSGPTPDLVIDSKGNLFNSTSAVTLSPRQIERTIDTTKLYQRIRIGSNETLKQGGTYTYPDIRYKSHKLEEYHTGEDGGSSLCHTENSLDLVSNYIIDSNVIERLIEEIIGGGGGTSNLDDIFFIECNAGLTQADRFDIINVGTGADYTYNEGLMNDAVIPRFDGDIFADLLIFLGDGNDGFEADETGSASYAAAGANYEPVSYDTEISDPNGNYDNAVNFAYTAPIDGFYRFSCSVEISNYVSTGPLGGGDLEVILRQRHYDGAGFGGGNLVSVLSSAINVVTGDTEVIYEPLGLFMLATETIRVRVEANWNGPAPGAGDTFDIDGGTFKTLEVETGGGTYADFDVDDTRLIMYEFKAPLGITDFDSMYSNQTQAITINLPGGGNKKMWINSLDWDFLNVDGGTFTCITTENT